MSRTHFPHGIAGAVLRRRLRGAALALGTAGLAACHAADASSSAPKGAVNACGDIDCSNAVDAVVVPMLLAASLPILPEDPQVLCRRMAIDLNGIVPSADEYRLQCAGKSPREMALYFMTKPRAKHIPDGSAPYVFVNRRIWADTFQYSSGLEQSGTLSSTFYVFVRDLDALVGQLYAGEIGYDTFAARAVSSPAFMLRFGLSPGNDALDAEAIAAYMAFLNEIPGHDVADNFGNLFRPWVAGAMNQVDGEAAYPGCPSISPGFVAPVGCAHVDLGVTGARCDGTFADSCASNVLGTARISLSQPGYVAWRDLSAQDRSALEAPGRVLAARPEFAEAAVDAALTKYLGWWATSTYVPNSVIPAVRDALAQLFVHDRFNVRNLDLEIVTSVLYTQAAARTATRGLLDPIWSFGPTKQLTAQAWLDTLGRATDKQLGPCDFRYNGAHAELIPGHFPEKSDVPGFSYAEAARAMGGCTVHTSPLPLGREPPMGLLAGAARRSALAAVCPGGFKATPDMTVTQVAELVFGGVGRDPSPDELATMVDSIPGTVSGACDPSVSPACDRQALADALCNSLFVTALHNYY